MTDKLEKKWQDWVNLVLGVWLVASPWVLGFTASEATPELANPFWNAIVVGAAVIIFALVAVSMPQVWEEAINLALGAWMVISPWVLDYSAMAMPTRNAVVTGLLVAGLALWAMMTREVSLMKWWHDRHSH